MKNLVIAVLLAYTSVKSGFFIPGYEVVLIVSLTVIFFLMIYGIEDFYIRNKRRKHTQRTLETLKGMGIVIEKVNH